MNKSLLLIALLIGVLPALNSCCTKAYCEGFDDQREVELYDFTESETDSIIVQSFVIGTNFTVRVDSFLISGNSSILIIEPFSTYEDHEFLFVSTGQIYRLTDLRAELKPCNSCFPSHPPSDYFQELQSYAVNGVQYYGSKIIITK